MPPNCGRRWFVCSVHANGRYCGRRVALLYLAGELFACRRCQPRATSMPTEFISIGTGGRADIKHDMLIKILMRADYLNSLARKRENRELICPRCSDLII